LGLKLGRLFDGLLKCTSRIFESGPAEVSFRDDIGTVSGEVSRRFTLLVVPPRGVWTSLFAQGAAGSPLKRDCPPSGNYFLPFRRFSWGTRSGRLSPAFNFIPMSSAVNPTHCFPILVTCFPVLLTRLLFVLPSQVNSLNAPQPQFDTPDPRHARCLLLFRSPDREVRLQAALSFSLFLYSPLVQELFVHVNVPVTFC